ncbi:MAG: FkbM family methyltransferase [Verrucomicrobia bacterium]|nr:FkbM family methyltransferase [Verrucomicrobiota bacterium]
MSCSAITKELICECVGKQNPTILEIGCNDGGHTLWFLKMFENPKIYCFEPDPRPIARFKTKFGQRPNVKLFEMALCDRNGEITFYQSDGHKAEAMLESWDLSGSIRQPKEHLTANPWVTFEQSITVESATLDTWCNEHGIEDIDFIWMDVQGAEIDVFRGGKNAFCKTRFVYTEYSNKELYKGQHTLKQLLRQLRHFEVLIRYSNDMLLRNKKFAFAPNKALQGMLSNSHR